MADTGLSTAQRQLAHGSKYPYDGGSEAAPAIDWAHAAARGVMADLLDRRGVKWELEKVDLDVRADIVTAVAAIVRAATPSPSTAPVKDHVVREVVNQLRDTALEFHAHGNLRERLARELGPLLVASRFAEVDGSPVDQACARVRSAEAELKAARKALMDVMTTAARTDE
jgi:hypothetical protein